eukprot:gnl/TRDRNA2_/TRDRNA2_197655_c0_seq1.p1 gnl/TRDRNA2_/TRDRNA2_197655_c0~~gnl/TRDRNA2_/TRDRNA2_197655_c0_seq1.p1  ORF type:complete len:320 (+),score=45.43 gnl/TRDRNA2_/TRDRNA2_197655_c0_seq1:50-1009(+)
MDRFQSLEPMPATRASADPLLDDTIFRGSGSAAKVRTLALLLIVCVAGLLSLLLDTPWDVKHQLTVQDFAVTRASTGSIVTLPSTRFGKATNLAFHRSTLANAASQSWPSFWPTVPYNPTFHGIVSLSNQRAELSGRKVIAGATSQEELDKTFVPWRLVKKMPNYQLRMYLPRKVIKTSYERRDEGMEVLQSYFMGENDKDQKFPVTQPVIMSYETRPDGGFENKTIQLYLGSGVKAPPTPKRLDCDLAVEGGELMAVIRFDGFASPENTLRNRDLLLAQLEQDGLRVPNKEKFMLAQYGQMFALERINEVLITVTLAD